MRSFLFAALSLALCLIAWSATGGSISGATGGSISGKVTGPDGMPVAGARLTAISEAQGTQTSTKSDAKGGYRFPLLAVGQYDITVEANGFAPLHRKGLVLHVNDSLKIDLMLETAGASK